MRLACISDCHGNLVALEAVLADVRRNRPDRIYFLGDAVLKGPQPAECVEVLRSLGVPVLMGNCDAVFDGRYPPPGWQPLRPVEHLNHRNFFWTRERLSDADIAWLTSRPDHLTETLAGRQVEFFHAAPDSLSRIVGPGAPAEAIARLHRHEDTRLSLFGHVHFAFTRTALGRTVVNAGSAGLPFDRDPRAGYVLIDLDGAGSRVQFVRVPYDVEEAVRRAFAAGMPDAGVYARCLREGIYPYDWEQVSAP